MKKFIKVSVDEIFSFLINVDNIVYIRKTNGIVTVYFLEKEVEVTDTIHSLKEKLAAIDCKFIWSESIETLINPDMVCGIGPSEVYESKDDTTVIELVKDGKFLEVKESMEEIESYLNYYDL